MKRLHRPSGQDLLIEDNKGDQRKRGGKDRLRCSPLNPPAQDPNNDNYQENYTQNFMGAQWIWVMSRNKYLLLVKRRGSVGQQIDVWHECNRGDGTYRC